MKDDADDYVDVDDLVVIARTIGKDFPGQVARRRARSVLLKLLKELAAAELRKLKGGPSERR